MTTTSSLSKAEAGTSPAAIIEVSHVTKTSSRPMAAPSRCSTTSRSTLERERSWPFSGAPAQGKARCCVASPG